MSEQPDLLPATTTIHTPVSAMTFSPVEHATLAACVELFVSVFNNPPWNERWDAETVTQRLKECYHTPGFAGLMVNIGNTPVGFAVGYIERWDTSKHFYLKEMCVAPEQQGRGVGTALLNALEKTLQQQGVEKIYLHTARDTAAHAFYEKQGFYVSSKMIMMAKWLKSQ